jgi:hypothetical protein
LQFSIPNYNNKFSNADDENCHSKYSKHNPQPSSSSSSIASKQNMNHSDDNNNTNDVMNVENFIHNKSKFDNEFDLSNLPFKLALGMYNHIDIFKFAYSVS